MNSTTLSSLHCDEVPKAELMPKTVSRPHDLEQHIKKIISENAAIVETLDPLWSKKYMTSRHHSTSSIPSSKSLCVTTNNVNNTSPTVTPLTSSSSFPVTSGFPSHYSSLEYSSSSNKRRYSEVSFLDRSHVGSRLQSALMGKSLLPSTQEEEETSSSSFLNNKAIMSSAKTVIPSSLGAVESVIKSGKQVSSDQLSHYSFSGGEVVSGNLVRDLLTSKVPLPVKKHLKNNPLNGDHPENPERSVIKDLLLKAREAQSGSPNEDYRERSNTGKRTSDAGESSRKRSSPINSFVNTPKVLPVTFNGGSNLVVTPTVSSEQELSMLYYVCTICKIAFRNKENLEAHQLHYCKGTVSAAFFPSQVGHHHHPLSGSHGLDGLSFQQTKETDLGDPFTLRKISVLDNAASSVLHRRLTEGRSSGVKETGATDSSSACKEGTSTQFLGNKNNLVLERKAQHLQSSRLNKSRQDVVRQQETPPTSSLESPVSLGMILKKTLEGPKKRKISEPVFPSRQVFLTHSTPHRSLFHSNTLFAGQSSSSSSGHNNSHHRMTDTTKSVMSAVAVASRKVSVLQSPHNPSGGTSVKATFNQEDVDSFTRQVSMMLERTKEKNQPITLSPSPETSSVAVYVPFSGVSVIPGLVDHPLTFMPSSFLKDLPASSSSMTNNISKACPTTLTSTVTEGVVPSLSVDSMRGSTRDKGVSTSLEMLSEYLPHVKSGSTTKITLKGPLVFPVLERILSEDKDIIEFQVKHPSEIGVNGLFDVNMSSSSTSPHQDRAASSSSTTNSSLFVDPLASNAAFLSSLSSSSSAEKTQEIEEEKEEKRKVKEEESEGHSVLEEESQQQEQLNERPSGLMQQRLPSHSSMLQSNSSDADDGDDEASDDEHEMQTEDKDIKNQADNTNGDTSSSNSSLEKGKEEECPASSSSRRPSTLDIVMTAGLRKKRTSSFNHGMMIQTMVGSNIISPDTPRPKKTVSQQYLNGHAYTYIGLKVSTRSTYCCIYRPQPMFVPQETCPKLSMYSNWRTSCSPVDSFIEEVSPKGILASYDSRLWKYKENETSSPLSYYVVSNNRGKQTLPPQSEVSDHSDRDQEVKSSSLLTTDDLIMTDSKYWYNKIVKETTMIPYQVWLSQQQVMMDDNLKRKLSSITGPTTGLSFDMLTDTSRKISNCEDASMPDGCSSLSSSFLGCDSILRKISEDRTSSTSFDSDCDPNQPKRVKIFEGGFKSNEDYTYVRGRGRGKYVCEECGIRCKKPSMLKKHIRTHTDLRPYSCRHCAFAFKTKGNLTKHMKSKAHHKKCVELGIYPVPTSIDDSQIDSDALAKQEQLERRFSGGNLMSEDDDDDEEDEDNESDDEGVPIPLIGPGQHYSSYLAANPTGSVLFSPEKASRKVSFISSHNNSSNGNHLNHHNQQSSLLEGSAVNTTTSSECIEVSRRTSVVNKNEEQEVAQSLLFLSGSWTDSFKQQNRTSKAGDAAAVMPSSTALSNSASGVTLSPPSSQVAHVLNMTSLSKSSDEDKNKLSSPSSRGSKTRKVSILESTLTPGSAWQSINPYLSRPRSFSFNDVPAMRVSSSGGHGHHTVDNNNNNSSRVNLFQPHNLSPPSKASLNEKLSPPNGLTSGVSMRPALPRLIVHPPNELEGKQTDFALHNKGNGHQRRDTFSPGDRLLIAEGDHLNVEEEESDEEMIDVEETRSRSFSSTWNSSKIREMTMMLTQEKSTAAEEEEPMDLSKRSNTGTDGSTNEEEDMDDDTDEGIFDHSIRNMSGKQDFMPIPLASGAEGGEGKCVCTICQKIFSKPSQLRLHVNIHYFERPFRCEACAVSFRTKGHLQKHKRSVSHYNKVNMNKTFGTPSNDNPRPFKCSDCKVAFRIHGHLAKHLRSKLHIMKLECLNKLPFGMFAEMERSGVNLNEIDTSDCDNSLISLQALSKKMSAQPGSSLDLTSMQLVDVDSMSDQEEVDDDSDGIIDEVVPSPVKKVKVEDIPSTASSTVLSSSLTTSTPSNRLFHPDFLAVSSHDLRERSVSFSGMPATHASPASMVPHHERRVTVFSSNPEAIARQALMASSSLSTNRPLLTPVSGSQTSFATRSNTCDLCGQVFKSAKFLQVHLYSDHSPEQQPRSSPLDSQSAQNNKSSSITTTSSAFECNVCLIKLPSVPELQQHLLTHSSSRPFICQVCDAGFTTSAQLAAHLPSHAILQVR